MNHIQLRNRMIVGGIIVFGVFAVGACLISLLNKGEPMTSFIVVYALIAVSGAITAAVGGMLYLKVSGKVFGKVKELKKEKPEKMQKPEKIKAVAEKKPEKVKIQKPKKSLKELFGGLLESLSFRKKKAVKKVAEVAEELAEVEEAFQPEIQDEIKEPIEVMPTEVKETAQAEEEKTPEPSDAFFDDIISGEGDEDEEALSQEIGKEKKDEDSTDDFIELTPLDEVLDEESDDKENNTKITNKGN